MRPSSHLKPDQKGRGHTGRGIDFAQGGGTLATIRAFREQMPRMELRHAILARAFHLDEHAAAMFAPADGVDHPVHYRREWQQ